MSMQLTKVWQKRIEWEFWANQQPSKDQRVALAKAWDAYRAALTEEQKAYSLGD